MIPSITLFFITFAFAVTATALVRRHSIATGFVARPVADRHHRTIIPLGGGIAIFATIEAALIIGLLLIKFILLTGRLDSYFPQASIYAADFMKKSPQLIVILICLPVLFITGLIDDKKRLSPYPKLIIQFAVALSAAYLGDIRIEFFIESKIATSILSAFWIVFLINAFNFLDNMDGLSAGVALIVSAIMLVAAIISQQVFVSALAIVFIAALLGFLVFNFPPAKIFMGDAGSLVIGFTLAVLSLRTTYYQQAHSGQWYPVLMPLIIMAVPLYDFLSVTALRISQGKSPFVGDTQHFSHRLTRHGFSDTQAVLILYLATICTGLSAVFLYQVTLAGAMAILAQTIMILAIIAIFESTAKNDKTPNNPNS